MFYLKAIMLLQLCLPGVIPAADLQARLDQDMARGVVSAKDHVMQRLYAAYEPARLSEPYRSLEAMPHGCGTLLLLEARNAQPLMTGEEQAWLLAKAADRRTLPFSFIMRDFKIHYTRSGSDSVDVTDSDASGTPDFVEQVAVAFNSCYDEFQRIGYRRVASDGIAGGGPEIDIYLYRVSGFYGQFYFPPDVHMQMDPRFDAAYFTTKGIDGARVTIAHELHHAVQFGYTTIGRAFSGTTTISNYAFFEMTSTFMEDYMFDSVNDYLQYLPHFLPLVEKPFTEYSGYYHYGNSLYNHMLQERFGSVPLRLVWERMAANPAFVDALDFVLTGEGLSFHNVLNDYHRWNFFTGVRADHDYSYDEGEIFNSEPPVSMELVLETDTTVTALSKGYLTPAYLSLVCPTPDSIRLELTAQEGNANWRYSVVRLSNDKPVATIAGTAVNSIMSVIEYFAGADQQAVLMVSNVARQANNTNGGNYSISVKAIHKHADSTGSPVDPIPETLVLWPNYPNPFNAETFLPFSLPAAARIRMTVYDLLGRTVKLLDDAEYGAGAHALTWDGRNTAGLDVAAGVYLYRLDTGAFTQTRKMLLLR